MSVQSDIETKLTAALDLKHLEVINESNNHNVPPGSESHFKLVLVATDFDGLNLVNRHRKINQILAHELQHRIHALALHTFTEQEWYDRNEHVPMSPPCLGGSKSQS
ncbi:MAG: BolA/IbaG family iron-sulfur metabolism protein [Gammaproteobacteria bacterium]|nr:BolA/IbaG family iron-sulfur metabolism protein [Gammaproteobacteria bacterium]MDH5801708.1 BolA/IbaG family iron-sulfur metabolism protein [Gammaproteobacteria bacterium]